MIALTIAFPNIDPIAVQIGPLAIRWYALAYITGIILGWWYVIRLSALPPKLVNRTMIDDFVVWLTLGVIIGGRLGYVLFYKPGYYLQDPLEVLYLWHGGMSFHGGALGVIGAIFLFAWRRGISPFALGDLVTCAVPIGLFFGRIANFINGELYGRVSDVAWAMVFPHGGPFPRHPSQLYEAFFEGLLLFAVLAWFARRRNWLSQPGRLSGLFLAGYAVARMSGELFREPDGFVGFLVGGLTMGQALSLPMLIVGIGLMIWAGRRTPVRQSTA